MRPGKPEIDLSDAEQLQSLEQQLADANRALARQHEAALAMEREREILEKLFERLPVMITIYDPELHNFRVNQALERILGYNQQDLAQPGFDLLEHVYPDREYRQSVKEYMQSLKEGWLDLEATAKDGQRVESSWSNVRLSDETQIGIGIDIRDRKLAEQALRESNERFRLALSSTAITVFTTDLTLRYTWIYNNSTAGARTASSFLGKRDDELLPPEEAAELLSFKQLTLDSGRGARRELKISSAGVTRVYVIALEPLRNPAGEIVGLTGAALEVTQQRQAEQEALQNQMQMEVQRRLIEHREQERMEIARELHDGPLQDMIAVYFTIKEALQASQTSQLQDNLAMLEASLKKQISNLRSFCTELRPPALGPFGLEKVILSHVETFRERHPEITFYLMLQNDRDFLDETVRMALFRVYQEALNNIVRHAQANQVWIRLEIDSHRIRLEIRDNGVGFEAQEEWIEYARKGHFGLVGMQERIQSVCGSLLLHSAPGQGAWLVIEVPLTPPAGH